MKDCDTETTISIDMRKFPREYWTGDSGNPFMRLDSQQMDDVDTWVRGLVPKKDEYCAELIGRAPLPVAALIGSILQETGCQKMTCVHPGSGVTLVWDYTVPDDGEVDEVAKAEVLGHIGYTQEAAE